jgi:superoxide dismutase, Fe-Mn family
LEFPDKEDKVSSKVYSLPALPYGYGDLAPYVSAEQLTLHHTKHHQAYITGANNVLSRLEKARAEGAEIDMRATLKELSFHLGGNELHTIFWYNMAPAGKGGGGEPADELAAAINAEFGNFARFKKEFSQAASTVEGSGWAALTYLKETGRLAIIQIEKHNVNFPAGFPVLMALDVWEHAYYLDYKNDRAKFIEAFWNIVNWGVVGQKFEML